MNYDRGKRSNSDIVLYWRWRFWITRWHVQSNQSPPIHPWSSMTIHQVPTGVSPRTTGSSGRRQLHRNCIIIFQPDQADQPFRHQHQRRLTNRRTPHLPCSRSPRRHTRNIHRQGPGTHQIFARLCQQRGCDNWDRRCVFRQRSFLEWTDYVVLVPGNVYIWVHSYQVAPRGTLYLIYHHHHHHIYHSLYHPINIWRWLTEPAIIRIQRTVPRWRNSYILLFSNGNGGSYKDLPFLHHYITHTHTQSLIRRSRRTRQPHDHSLLHSINRKFVCWLAYILYTTYYTIIYHNHRNLVHKGGFLHYGVGECTHSVNF